MVSQSARRGYDNGWFSFSDFEDINDIKKIKLLLSASAQKCYQNNWVNFQELKNTSIENLEIYLSDHAFIGYRNGYFQYGNLKLVFDLETKRVLISPGALKGYRNCYFTFWDLSKILDPAKLERLISVTALKIYESGVKFNKLKHLGEQKLLAKFDCFETERLEEFVSFF